MDTTPVTRERLAASVIAVPPLARGADLTLNDAENARLIRHLETGGISTLLYGGNANLYHSSLSEYGDLLALLADAYTEEELPDGESRTVLRLHPAVAPIKAAVLPLSKKLAEPAGELATALRRRFNVFYDDAGNIGRRYRRPDEAGTPFCLTYDFDSVDDQKVTVRERDTMKPERIAVDAVIC